MCFPDKIGPRIKADIEVSNNDLLMKSHHKLFLTVYLKPDIYCPFIEKNHFIHLVKLVQDNSILWLLPWLKVLQKVEHEDPVGMVLKREECRLVAAVHVLKNEHTGELVQEVLVEKLDKDVALDFWW
jgi:hypothetical protein